MQDVSSRSFWIGTFALPILMIGFGIFIGVMSSDSETLQNIGSMGQKHDELNGIQLLGLMAAMFLTIFLMVYGSMIFNKVKSEKTSRIMEMIATTVSGRTMMLGKVISVALIGATQILVWMLLIITGVMVILTMTAQPDVLNIFSDNRIWLGFICAIVYFFGGYLFFGSLYAMIGAMTDKDNENQGYMVVLTFILMASFYISSFCIDNPHSSMSIWCSYIPLTSPSIGAMSAISGTLNIWQVMLSLLLLYVTAWISITISGKVYTSTMLLNGTKFKPKDILTFIKSN